MTAWREAVTLSGRHVTLRPLARSDRGAIGRLGTRLDRAFRGQMMAPEGEVRDRRGLLDHRA